VSWTKIDVATARAMDPVDDLTHFARRLDAVGDDGAASGFGSSDPSGRVLRDLTIGGVDPPRRSVIGVAGATSRER
jgi:hypothetical protein